MSAETLEPADSRWEELVDGSGTPDVYYRPGYCAAYEAAGHGRAVAARTDDALYPLLLRRLPFGENGFDAVTPYGYGGVLPQGDSVTNLRQLRAWCVTNGVVSVLIRLHPVLGGPRQLSEIDEPDVEIREHGPTTAIDPRRIDPTTGRLAGMSKGRKADLTIARRELELAWGGAEALEDFRGVYDQTMERLGAGEYYVFSSAYYEALAAGLGDRLGVALARRAGETVGAALFMADGRFAHYHLSGATDTGRELKAGTLLVHAGAEWAAARGCELLHLGGGTAGADSLFAFKKSFGGEDHRYAFATLIADRRRYDALVARRADEPEPPRPGFFPAYRA